MTIDTVITSSGEARWEIGNDDLPPVAVDSPSGTSLANFDSGRVRSGAAQALGRISSGRSEGGFSLDAPSEWRVRAGRNARMPL